MKSAIILKLVNRSEDATNNEIVVFQKNIGDIRCHRPVAWQVFKNLPFGDQQSFNFSSDFQVSTKDGWGQPLTKSMDVTNGHRYSLYKDIYGRQLQQSGASSHYKTIEIQNNLNKGNILAELYKGGKLLAKKTHISPKKAANFRFRHSIWLGVVQHVNEGEIIPVKVLDAIQNEIYLRGVLSADIILTGNEQTGYQFQLENILFQG